MQQFDPMALGAKPVTADNFDPIALGAKPVSSDQKPVKQMSFKDKIKYLQSLPEEERKQKLKAGELIFQQSRNLEKEKSGVQKFVEGAGQVAGIAGQIALEAIGKRVAGKKGSAAAAAAGTAARKIASESWQNVTGYQDQPPMESLKSVFVEPAQAAALDLAINTAFDDIIPGIKKQVTKVPFISQWLGTGKAAQETMAGEIVAKGNKAYEALTETTGDPKQFFLDSGMPKIKWWEPAKNTYDKFEPMGVIVNKTRIGELSKQLDPILEQATKDGTRLDYITAKKMFSEFRKKQLIKNINKSGLDESAMSQAVADGGKILDDILTEIKAGGLTPKEAKKIASELFEGAYTPAGKAKAGLSPTAQKQVASMLSKWVKDTVPGAKEILGQQTNLYRLNDLIETMAPKVQKEFGKDMFANLSKEQVRNLALQVGTSIGLFGIGSAVENPYASTALRLAGAAAGVAQLPYLKTQLTGGSEMSLYKELGEKAIPSMKKEVVGAASRMAGRNVIQELFNMK